MLSLLLTPTQYESLQMIADGRLVLQRKNKYKLAGVCFHHTGAQDRWMTS